MGVNVNIKILNSNSHEWEKCHYGHTASKGQQYAETNLHVDPFHTYIAGRRHLGLLLVFFFFLTSGHPLSKFGLWKSASFSAWVSALSWGNFHSLRAFGVTWLSVWVPLRYISQSRNTNLSDSLLRDLWSSNILPWACLCNNVLNYWRQTRQFTCIFGKNVNRRNLLKNI